MAFYWSHLDVSIVLTDDEEMQLVRELAGPNRPQDVVGYNVHRTTRRKYEGLMRDHFKRTLADDPCGQPADADPSTGRSARVIPQHSR